MFRLALSRGVSAVTRVQPRIVAQAAYSSGHHESAEAFDARWEALFQRSDLDGWDLRHSMNDLYGHDVVPEPKIVSAALHACRRLDDFAMAVRVLEMVREKAVGNTEILSYMNAQLKPTLEELGISTPEQIGV